MMIAGRWLLLAAMGSAALAWSASAAAVTCYVVMDRNDNITYRGSLPPVDLSDEGAPARERMRQRGEYLMFGEFDSCPGVTFFTGVSGSKGLALDEVVMGMPPGAGASAAKDAAASGSASAAGAPGTPRGSGKRR